MNKIILTAFLFLTINQIGLAQTNFNKEKLDRYFSALEKNNKFMGSVAVSKNGEIIYTRAIGFADIEQKIKASEKTKYRIGSISKTFTAVLVLKAIERGKFELNQTIDKWFPKIRNSNKITIKSLLSHRSGIHNFTNTPDYLIWHTEPKTKKEMVTIISKGGSDFEPDIKAEYSNSNFVLLTYILEQSFSKSYSELLQEYIVKPIELTDTYIFGKININNNECKSYKFIHSWREEPETDYTIPLGAGAITSTPRDLTKFADALFGGKLLSSESLDIMKTIKDGYGSGLFQIPFYKSTGYGHPGGIDGFSSIFSHFADEKISFALTSNGTNLNNNDISIAVLSAVYNKPYKIPTFTIFELNSTDLDKYLGVYSSNQLPLKITVTKDKNTLIAQGTGQPAFPLEATGKNKFKLEKVGVELEFHPSEKIMLLFQRGSEFKFKRE